MNNLGLLNFERRGLESTTHVADGGQACTHCAEMTTARQTDRKGGSHGLGWHRRQERLPSPLPPPRPRFRDKTSRAGGSP
jgi:hypothetical protein